MKVFVAFVIGATILVMNLPTRAADNSETKETYKGVGDKNEPPPPVDLRDKKEPLVVDPGDLKRYDPKPPSLKIKPPPPLQ